MKIYENVQTDIIVVRHGERVDMKTAGGRNWFYIPEWADGTTLTLPSRTLYPNDLDWNPPLSATGHKQAFKTALQLKKIISNVEQVENEFEKVDHIIRVYSSPAFRCQQTSHHIATQLHINFRILSGLYELFEESTTFGGLAARKFGDPTCAKGTVPPPWVTAQECDCLGMKVDTEFVDYSSPTLLSETQNESNIRTTDTFKAIIDHLLEETKIGYDETCKNKRKKRITYIIVAHEGSHISFAKYLHYHNISNLSSWDLLPQQSLEQNVTQLFYLDQTQEEKSLPQMTKQNKKVRCASFSHFTKEHFPNHCQNTSNHCNHFWKCLKAACAQHLDANLDADIDTGLDTVVGVEKTVVDRLSASSHLELNVLDAKVRIELEGGSFVVLEHLSKTLEETLIVAEPKKDVEPFLVETLDGGTAQDVVEGSRPDLASETG